MILDFTEHFTDPDNQKRVNLSEIEKDNLFCAKYSKDDYWYRVRVLRTPTKFDDTVFVDFVDYGNEENVSIDSLREIPKDFDEYKHLPFQVFLQ